MVESSTHAIRSKGLFLLGLNVVLLLVGGLIEIYAAIVVVVPLLVPVGIAFGIDPVDLVAGKLPRRQRRLVEAWAELHQEELMAWDHLQAGRPPQPIEPLK